MILVDTSVWVDHIRKNEDRLVTLLSEGLILCHPFVIEELACGTLPRRNEFLGLLETLPMAPTADHYEVLDLIAATTLHGTGLGMVDAHLIASALLADVLIWTKDRALSRATERIGCA